MASGRFAAFKDVAWAKALSAAPALVDKGKQLWGRVAMRKPSPGPRAAEAHAEIEVRAQVLEQRVSGLEDEAVSSFEVVRSIAEQHSQLAEQNARLVEAVDVLLERTRLLGWACMGLAVAALVLLVLVLV